MGILAVLMQFFITKRVLLVFIFHPPLLHGFLASTYSANRNSLPTCWTLSRYPLFLYICKLNSLLFGKYVSSAGATNWRLTFTLPLLVVGDVHVDSSADGIVGDVHVDSRADGIETAMCWLGRLWVVGVDRWLGAARRICIICNISS